MYPSIPENISVNSTILSSLGITNVESSIKPQYASTQIRSHTLVNLYNWFALQTNFFVFYSLGGVRLPSLGAVAINRPAPNDKGINMDHCWNE